MTASQRCRRNAGADNGAKTPERSISGELIIAELRRSHSPGVRFSWLGVEHRRNIIMRVTIPIPAFGIVCDDIGVGAAVRGVLRQGFSLGCEDRILGDWGVRRGFRYMTAACSRICGGSRPWLIGPGAGLGFRK